MKTPSRQPDKPSSKGRRLERCLLIVILIVQGIMLYGLFVRQREPDADSCRPDMPASAESETHASVDPQVQAVVDDDTKPLMEDEFARIGHSVDRHIRELMGLADALDAYRDSHLPPSRRAHQDRFFSRRVDRLFERALGDIRALDTLVDFDDGWTALLSSPTMDMRDREHDYLVMFSLPGLDGAKINITLEGRLLTVSSRSSHPARRSAQHVQFERRVWLPGPVASADSAEAVLTNGVLTVVVPKSDTAAKAPGRTRIM